MRLYEVSSSEEPEATASFTSPNIHHCVPPKKVSRTTSGTRTTG